MIRLMRKLGGEERGAAAVEFALWSSMFFIVVMAAIDFGAFYLERGKMNEAVTAGAVQSFANADSVNFGQLPAYVKAMADNNNMSVAVSCNGVASSCTNLSRTCACLRTDGTYYMDPSNLLCGDPCSGSDYTSGTTAGYYLTIEGTQGFQPMMLPRGVLGGTQIVQQATVRLQ